MKNGKPRKLKKMGYDDNDEIPEEEDNLELREFAKQKRA
jgi:hypothetical protein